MRNACRRAAVAAALMFPLAALAADPLPSLDELQKYQADKNWPELLKGTTRILQLRGPATSSYHRTIIWQLKAEALINSGQSSASAAAFSSGAGEKDATDDEKDLCLASAMVVKKASGKTFKLAASPVNPAPQQFDVTDPDQRKKAMAALLADELSAAKPAVDRLKDTLVAPPLVKVAKELDELAPLERVTEKGTDKIDELEKTLAANFTAAITDWKTKTSKQLDDLAKSAQETITTRYTDSRGFTHMKTGPRGLTPAEQTDVRKIGTDARGYAQVEEEIAAALTDQGKDEIKKAKPPIQAVFDQAQSTLHDALLAR